MEKVNVKSCCADKGGLKVDKMAFIDMLILIIMVWYFLCKTRIELKKKEIF